MLGSGTWNALRKSSFSSSVYVQIRFRFVYPGRYAFIFIIEDLQTKGFCIGNSDSHIIRYGANCCYHQETITRRVHVGSHERGPEFADKHIKTAPLCLKCVMLWRGSWRWCFGNNFERKCRLATSKTMKKIIQRTGVPNCTLFFLLLVSKTWIWMTFGWCWTESENKKTIPEQEVSWMGIPQH